MSRKNLPTGRPSSAKASLQATLTVGASVGLAIGSAMWADVARAAESANMIQVASALPANAATSPNLQPDPAQPDPALAMDTAPVQTAQLEWLFGPRRPAESLREPARPRTEGGKRYIYIQKRDEFGNLTTQRVLAAGQQPAQVKRPNALNDRVRAQTAERLRAAPPAPPTNGPLLITVSLARQQITLYDQGVAVAQSPISSGTRSRPTPTGVYSVIQKQWFHRSNMYSSAPMPYMQRLTWSGIALHGGDLPGYAASHGCIRLPEQFAIRLWGTTKPGVRVIVTHGEVKPVEIAHAALFVPKAKSAPLPAAPSIVPPAPPMVAPPTKPEAKRDAPATKPSLAVAPVVVARTDDETTATVNTFSSPAPASLMEEMENIVPAVAEIAIVRGAQGQSVATQARQADGQAVASNVSGVRTASITIIRGGQPMEFQTVDMPPVPVDAVPASSAASAQNGDGQIADVVDADDGERDMPQLALPALKEEPVLLAYSGSDFMQFAARTQRRVEAAPQVAPAEAAPAKIFRPGPVAVFISRKERRLYVRKGFEAVFDAPITITEPNESVGTYVFSATALTATGNAFKWNVVALANQNANKKAPYDDEKSLHAATQVLDRIKVPADIAARVSDIIEVGATVIVTDGGPGSPRSLSLDNDFSVVTR